MSFIVLLLATVALVWLTIYFCRGSLMWLGLVFLLVNSSFGVYFWAQEVGPLPLTLDRIVLVGLMGAYAWQRWLGLTEPKPLGTADYLLFAFMGVLTYSTFSHDWRTAPPEGIAPLWRLITGYLSPAIVYWLARQMKFGERESRQMLSALALFGIYLSITAFLEIAGQWSLVFPKTIAEPTLGLHFGRARGPMLHSVAYGFYLGSTLVAAWLWWPRHGRLGVVALGLLFPLFLAAAYFSYTRSVWMGIALGLGILLAATLRGSWRPLVLGSAIIVGSLSTVMLWDKLMGFEREYSAAGTRESAHLRNAFAYVSWLMFLDHPLLGCGLGQFFTEKNDYLWDRSTDIQLEGIRPLIHHNMPLDLLTETGIVGLGLFTALLVVWALYGWRVWQNETLPEWVRLAGLFFLGVLGVYLPQAVFHEVSYMNMIHSLLFFAAGITVGIYENSRARAARPATTSHGQTLLGLFLSRWHLRPQSR